jgi:M-phase inducer tyrosine phosphatase
LDYPEVYVLEGGYKKFYEEYKDRCHPQGYIEMAHENHIEDCKSSRREFKKARSFRDTYKRDRL